MNNDAPEDGSIRDDTADKSKFFYSVNVGGPPVKTLYLLLFSFRG